MIHAGKEILVLVLSLAGFATGAMLTRRWQGSSIPQPPYPLEVVLAAASLITVFLLRPQQYRATHALVSITVMAVVGMLVARAVGANKLLVAAGTREFEETNVRKNFRLWQRYLAFSRSVIDYEFRLVLVATYLVMVAPIALASRVSNMPAGQGNGSNWLPRQESDTIGNARRPY